MAKGQDLSRHQKKIVERYYEHRDTIMITKLQEMVSDLYLAEGKKAETLWKRAGAALEKTDADPKRWKPAVESRDLKKLADVVGDLAGPRR
jgi:hypothetical protein